jgi:hypothetical protein
MESRRCRNGPSDHCIVLMSWLFSSKDAVSQFSLPPFPRPIAGIRCTAISKRVIRYDIIIYPMITCRRRSHGTT